MIKVFCLDENTWYIMDAKTPYEALNKMLYYCNLKRNDSNAVINLSKSNRTAYFVHSNKTYSVIL